MTYELINPQTTNTLASFGSEEEARAALAHFEASDPRFAKNLVIVGFDQEGRAIEPGDDPVAASVKRPPLGGKTRLAGRRRAVATSRATARRRKR
jgi:hypothetical protein